MGLPRLGLRVGWQAGPKDWGRSAGVERSSHRGFSLKDFNDFLFWQVGLVLKPHL